MKAVLEEAPSATQGRGELMQLKDDLPTGKRRIPTTSPPAWSTRVRLAAGSTHARLRGFRFRSSIGALRWLGYTMAPPDGRSSVCLDINKLDRVIPLISPHYTELQR